MTITNTPKNINQILEEICDKNSIYNDILNNLLYPKTEMKNELISELAISFLTNSEKIENAYANGFFKYYFITAAKTQIQSSTSSFHKNCRKTIASELDISQSIDYNNDDYDLEYKVLMEEKHEAVQQAIQTTKVSWFEGEVFKAYFNEGLTYRAIEAKYDIDHVLAFNTVKKVLTKIKKNINNPS